MSLDTTFIKKPSRIKSIVLQLVNQLIFEVRKHENLEKIKLEVLDPLIQYTFSRLYPYILATSIVFFIIFLLAILIFLLILKMYWHQKD